jgi:hypothetical protein
MKWSDAALEKSSKTSLHKSAHDLSPPLPSRHRSAWDEAWACVSLDGTGDLVTDGELEYSDQRPGFIHEVMSPHHQTK